MARKVPKTSLKYLLLHVCANLPAWFQHSDLVVSSILP